MTLDQLPPPSEEVARHLMALLFKPEAPASPLISEPLEVRLP